MTRASKRKLTSVVIRIDENDGLYTVDMFARYSKNRDGSYELSRARHKLKSYKTPGSARNGAALLLDKLPEEDYEK